MKKYEERPVPQAVAVFYCDRCECQIPSSTRPYAKPTLGEGSHISGVRYGQGDTLRDGGRWMTFMGPVTGSVPDHERNGAEHAAAQVDLCEGCTTELLIWFAEGKPY